MATVTFDGVSRIYSKDAERPAVDSLNLDIADGEFLVLVGPSGCGKSTSLRMLAGLEPTDSGSIRIDGKDVTGVSPSDRDVAMVFQNYALYPNMTVAQNMSFALENRKMGKALIKERVQEAAKILQMEDLLDRKPANLSGGQRQRVAMGRAIVREPAVFCMDEPLSNLDAKLRVSTRAQISELQRRLGTTTVYVTHDQTEAMTMATKIILLDQGKIQQVGAPNEFYQRPENLFVAGFIGSPTMNIIEGKIENGLFVNKSGLMKIRANDKDSAILKNYEGKEVYLGIRSERFIAGESEVNSVTSTIDVIEMLGKEQIIYSKMADGTELVTSQPGHFEYRIGETHTFSLDPDALHFFDGETTNRIN